MNAFSGKPRVVVAGLCVALLLAAAWFLRGPSDTSSDQVPAGSRPPGVRPPGPPLFAAPQVGSEVVVEGAAPSVPSSGAVRPVAPPKRDLEYYQKPILDVTLEPVSRVVGLKKLLHNIGPSGRTPEVVNSMTRLLATSQDASIRAELCELLRGVEQPEFRSQLLVTVRTDPEGWVRAAAVETLASKPLDDIARLTLEQALQVETNPLAKMKLEKALRKR